MHGFAKKVFPFELCKFKVMVLSTSSWFPDPVFWIHMTEVFQHTWIYYMISYIHGFSI